MVTLRLDRVQYVELFEDQKLFCCCFVEDVDNITFISYVPMDGSVILHVLEPMELFSLTPDVKPALSDLYL